MSPSDSDTCPIKPIAHMGPPQNLTTLSWRALRQASDAARRLGLNGPFLCTNCMVNEAEDPSYFIEDAYFIAPASLFSAGHEGLVGACRSCAPEMHTLQFADDPRAVVVAGLWLA